MAHICDASTLRGMKDHVLGSDYANGHQLRDYYIDRIVSATAKTPCAASMLQQIFSNPNVARDRVREYADNLRRLQIPEEFQWLSNRVALLINLFAQC